MRPSSKVFCTGRLDIPEALIDDFVGISVFGDFLSCLAVRDEFRWAGQIDAELNKSHHAIGIETSDSLRYGGVMGGEHGIRGPLGSSLSRHAHSLLTMDD